MLDFLEGNEFFGEAGSQDIPIRTVFGCFWYISEIVMKIHLLCFSTLPWDYSSMLGVSVVSVEVEIKHAWVVVSNIFYFHPYLGKISILTNIFQMD